MCHTLDSVSIVSMLSCQDWGCSAYISTTTLQVGLENESNRKLSEANQETLISTHAEYNQSH